MSTALVKELRDRTGAGIMECKRALVETDGNIEKAVEVLRQQGIAKAGKKSGRAARQGVIDTYIHAGGRIGALVELNCETDFVARTDDFKSIARELAMQVAAMNPRYITADEIPSDEREAGIREYGSEKKYLEAATLLGQAYIREPRRSMDDLVKDGIAKLGENIVVRRIARFEVGEMSGDDTGADE